MLFTSNKISCKLLFIITLMLGLCFNLSSQTGSIKASMYAVPVEDSNQLGTVRIYWTSDVSQTKVYARLVESEYGPIPIATEQSSGERIATWIQKGKHYEFTLFARINGAEIPLDTIVVTGIETIQPAVGLSCFLLARSYLKGYLQNQGDSDGLHDMTKAMAQKAVQDAKERGFNYVRVPVSSWYVRTKDLELYLNEPAVYWQRMDEFMNYMSANEMKVIPILFHSYRSLGYYFDESNRDAMLNPNSSSYVTLRAYISEYVNRYKDHPALHLYEISGELNSRADIDILSIPSENSFEFLENFNTDEMMAFFEEICDLIRSIDDNHMISSGFSMPRKNSNAVRLNPFGSSGHNTAKQNIDNLVEFTEYMSIIHEPFDVVCVHVYNSPNFLNRFGLSNDPYSADIVDVLKQISDDQHKQLYLGELGDIQPVITLDQSAQFSTNMMSKIVEHKIPLSTPFVWQNYNNRPYEPMRYNIEPGYTDEYIFTMMVANFFLGNQIDYPTANEDTIAPRVVLTYPFDGTSIATDTQLIYAVASDYFGIEKVEFLVNGQLVFTDLEPPYQYNYPMENCDAKIIEAKAYDANGLISIDAIETLTSCVGSITVYDFVNGVVVDNLLYDSNTGLQDPNADAFWLSNAKNTRVTIQNVTLNRPEQLFSNQYTSGYFAQDLPNLPPNREFKFSLYEVNTYSESTMLLDTYTFTTSNSPQNRIASSTDEFYKKEMNFKVYPNPTTKKIQIDITLLAEEPLEVIITDINGREVDRQLILGHEGANQLEISVEQLESGQYFIQCNHFIKAFIKK